MLNDDARIVHDALLRCIMCLYQVVLIRMPQSYAFCDFSLENCKAGLMEFMWCPEKSQAERVMEDHM